VTLPPTAAASPHRLDRNVLVLVDESGRPTGTADKVEAHRGQGLLHRAVTCLLFDGDNRLLFARRALGKLLWPGYWDATVATHPAPGEPDSEAAHRRTGEELTLAAADLTAAGRIVYHAAYDRYWCEREHCAILLGRVTGTATPVIGQVDEVEWVEPDGVAQFTTVAPVAPWFLLAWQQLNGDGGATLGAWLRK